MTMTHYHYRRRPGPIAALFWMMIAVCALIAIGEQAPPFGAIFAVLLLGVIIAGFVANARAQQRAAVARSRPRSSVERVTIERQPEDCGRCGAPVQGGTHCPFCQTRYYRGGVRRTTERLS